MSAPALATTGISLILVFIACCLAMHVLQPDLSPLDDAISFYMNGDFGWILGAGIVALGVGSLLLARSMPSGRSRAGIVLLTIWGLCIVLGGLFPPDPRGHWDKPPSLSGMIHGSAAMIAFFVFPAAALLLSSGAALLRWLAVLSALSLAVFFFSLAPAFSNRAPYMLGLTERILIGLYVAWLSAAGLRVIRAGR